MGRAGGGHMGGGGHSAGGHMGGSHSGGGHMGGGFGGMGGMGHGDRGSNIGGMGHGGRRPDMGGMGGPRRRGFFGGWFPWYGGYGGFGYHRGCGCLGTIIMVVVIVIIMIAVSLANWITGGTTSQQDTYNTGNIIYVDNNTNHTSNTTTREKVVSDIAFNEDCIIDELDWLADTDALIDALEYFYDATGIQPYIYLRAYDSSLSTNNQKENFAIDWYESNIDNEITFLFVYFSEKNSSSTNGYMVYVNGYDIEDVMDNEAIDIFWDYVDSYFYSSLSADEKLIQIFESTADAIMP